MRQRAVVVKIESKIVLIKNLSFNKQIKKMAFENCSQYNLKNATYIFICI